MIKTSRQLKDLIRNLSAKKKTEPLAKHGETEPVARRHRAISALK